MATRRSNLWVLLALVPVVLTLTLVFWGFAKIIIGSGGDDDGASGGAGVDLTGTPFADIIKGCGGSDTILGEEGNDRIFGDGRPAACQNPDPEAEDENDAIFGGIGNDYINGEGSLWWYYGFGGDYIDGEDGRDRISGDDGDDEIHGGAGNDRLDGGGGNDSLYGEEGNDVLYGGDGDDFLDGGDGNDTLDGGPGTDHLIGGGGDDIFYLRPGQAGDGPEPEIVECTQNPGETGRVLLLRAGGLGFPRGTPSGTFTNTTVEIPDPGGGGVFSIQAGPGDCKIFRR
jgi:Ca2+-binding RTX toxin-like protein